MFCVLNKLSQKIHKGFLNTLYIPNHLTSALEYHPVKFVDEFGVGNAIRTWQLKNNWRIGRVVLWDYNFQLPNNRFDAEQPSRFLKAKKVNNLSASRLGDTIMEVLGPPNSIVKGETTVIIGG